MVSRSLQSCSKSFCSKGYYAILFGVRTDLEEIKEIAEGLEGAIIACDYDIRTVAALMTNCIFYFGNDTGVDAPCSGC
jgi:ADP-heptose:LPS heptosyltransferase